MNNTQLLNVEYDLYSRYMLCKDCANLCRKGHPECGSKYARNASIYKNRSDTDIKHLNRVRIEKNKRK